MRLGAPTVDWTMAPVEVRGTLRVRERREDDLLMSVFDVEQAEVRLDR